MTPENLPYTSNSSIEITEIDTEGISKLESALKLLSANEVVELSIDSSFGFALLDINLVTLNKLLDRIIQKLPIHPVGFEHDLIDRVSKAVVTEFFLTLAASIQPSATKLTHGTRSLKISVADRELINTCLKKISLFAEAFKQKRLGNLKKRLAYWKATKFTVAEESAQKLAEISALWEARVRNMERLRIASALKKGTVPLPEVKANFQAEIPPSSDPDRDIFPNTLPTHLINLNTFVAQEIRHLHIPTTLLINLETPPAII